MFSHILVPLDGSFLAERALPLATWLARINHASIALVWSVPEVLPMSMYASGTMKLMDEARENEIASAQNLLKARAAQKVLSGIDVSTEVLVGDPASQLLSYIRREQIDLVVICSHGRTGMSRWLLGSVTEELIRHSTVPILVIREDTVIPSMPQEEHVEAASITV